MLSKKNRLRSTREIERVFKSGRGYKEGTLFIKLAKNSSDDIRLAFVVSQKVAKKAYLRNKIKRRMRSAVRGMLSRAKKGLDVVIVAQKGIGAESFIKIKKNMEALFERAEII